MTETETLKARLAEVAGARLEERMSDISEDCYAAGWMSGLQYDLWMMVRGGDRSYGMGEVERGEVDELRKLSNDCGGWHNGDELIPLSAWKKEFARWWREDYLPSQERGITYMRTQIGTKDIIGRETTAQQVAAAERWLEERRAELPTVEAEAL